MLTQKDLEVSCLGPCELESPLVERRSCRFADESVRLRVEPTTCDVASQGPVLSYEQAGPRERIFFDPASTTAAIVTCGGLSPGLNNVIRSLYHELHFNYGVRRVLGIRNGYRGLNPAEGEPPMELDQQAVRRIHDFGGTVIGSSRGPQPPGVIVDFMESAGIDVLFCVGGDGTQRGASTVHEEISRRGLRKSIIGIPKTIDNDIAHVFPSFGYATALEAAAQALRAAHVEATNAPNGVSLVKVMGRNAGYIAAGAAMVSQEANFVLIPEIDFPLDGPDGLLTLVERRVVERGHALIIAAEGAGQHLFANLPDEKDASGNVRYRDIGPYLKDCLGTHFRERGVELNLRYIDPSYLIRSVPANAWDRILCDRMARSAAHAAMAGRTDMIIGTRTGALFHVPIPAVVQSAARMSPTGDLWTSVLATTGQPAW